MNEAKRLKDKLDELTSLIIRKKYPYCVTCKHKGKVKTDQLTNGHLFTRSHLSTRWDIQEGGNCTTQCIGCNMLHEHSPDIYFSWYLEKYGEKSFQELHKRHWKIEKIGIVRLREMVEEYKKILHELTQ